MTLVEIELLADHSESIPMLADWYESEWPPYYGAEGPGEARTDLESRCNRDEFPIGLVAADGTNVYGTAAIDLDQATGLAPSVVGLLVWPPRRRRGIATALIQSAEFHARRLGYNRLYLSTSILGNLLLRVGWHSLREVRFANNEQGTIYVRDL